MSSCPASGTMGGPIADGRSRFHPAPTLARDQKGTRVCRRPRSEVQARRPADANCPGRRRTRGLLGDRLGDRASATTCRSGAGAVWPAGGPGRARLGDHGPGPDPVRPTSAGSDRSSRRHGRRLVGSTGGGSRSGARTEARNHQDHSVRQGHPMIAAPGIRSLLTPQTIRTLLLPLPGGRVPSGRPAAPLEPTYAGSPVRKNVRNSSSPGGLRWPT
jgi:hypothetical protein